MAKLEKHCMIYIFHWKKSDAINRWEPKSGENEDLPLEVHSSNENLLKLAASGASVGGTFGSAVTSKTSYIWSAMILLGVDTGESLVVANVLELVWYFP